MKFTDYLSELAARMDFAALPDAAVDRAKQSVLDALGIALRASVDAELGAPIAAAVRQMAGCGLCTAVGHRDLLLPQGAALLNAVYIHSLDFDDVHIRGSVNPEAPVIAAALAAAEDGEQPGRALIAAVVAGYEVTCRVGMALGPELHFSTAHYTPAVAGLFGAAAAAGRIAGLTAGQLANAFGLAAIQAAGSLRSLQSDLPSRHLQMGMAAHNGLLAAVLAGHGVVGPAYGLERRWSFLDGNSDAEQGPQGFSATAEHWQITQSAFKCFPGSRLTHAALEGLLDVVIVEDLQAGEIEAVWIELPKKALELVAEPIELKRYPISVAAALQSMHWMAAAVITQRRLTWSTFHLVRDPAVLAVARRVEVTTDTEIDELFPTHFPGRVRVLARGREYQSIVIDPRGGPTRPVTWKELTAKFLGLAEGILPRGRGEQIIAATRVLQEMTNVRELTALLRPW